MKRWWLANWKRLATWTIAAAALVIVARAVPIRDRCEDPERPPNAARVAVSRESDGCILHRSGGDDALTPSACAALVCEPGLGSTLAHARVDLTIGLFLLYALSSLAWAARWRVLLGLANVRLSLREAWRITVEAQAGGVLLPGGIGGDALRIASVVERGALTSIAVGSVILDRLVGISTLALVALTLSIALGGGEISPFAMIMAAIPMGFFAGVAILRSPRVAAMPWLHRGRLGPRLKPILAYVGDRRAPGAIARAFVVSLVVSAIQLVVLRGLFVALGATPTAEKWVYLGSMMMFVAAALPALPGGWGTSDAVFVFFMARAGLPAASALATLLVYRVFWYTIGLSGSLLLLARRVRPGQ